MKAVEALGYAPNVAARSLALGGLDRIGLLYSNPSVGYLSEFLLGALEGVRSHGGQLIVEQCDDAAESEVAAIRRLAAGGVRGLLLPAPHGESVAALAEADRLGLRVVAVASGAFRSAATAVRIDDRAAAADMTRWLLDLGHRRRTPRLDLRAGYRPLDRRRDRRRRARAGQRGPGPRRAARRGDRRRPGCPWSAGQPAATAPRPGRPAGRANRHHHPRRRDPRSRADLPRRAARRPRRDGGDPEDDACLSGCHPRNL